jgi:hypothetical protein
VVGFCYRVVLRKEVKCRWVTDVQETREMFIARIDFCITDGRINIACTNSVELQGVRGAVRSYSL